MHGKLRTALTLLSLSVTATIMYWGCTRGSFFGDHREEAAAYAVLNRLIGERAEDFDLRLYRDSIQPEYCIFGVEQQRPFVRANSLVGLCKGAYEILRRIQAAHFSWAGSRVALPRVWPALDPDTLFCTIPYRLAMHPDLQSYEGILWDKERWRYELDLLAIHGYNAPLLSLGSLVAWLDLWKSEGVSQQDLLASLPAAPFSHLLMRGEPADTMGTLDPGYVQYIADLHTQLTAWCRQLDMHPVATAFAGYAPAAAAALLPASSVYIEGDPGEGLPAVDAGTQDFLRLSARFFEQYEDRFGRPDGWHLRLFATSPPQRALSGRNADLEELGKDIWGLFDRKERYQVLFLDTEPFSRQTGFWTRERLVALFRHADPAKVCLLESGAADEAYWWRSKVATVPLPQAQVLQYNTSGSNQTMASPAPAFVRFGYIEDSGIPILGWGGFYAGTHSNTHIFALTGDLAWDRPPDLRTWLEAFCNSRYGACSVDLLLGLKLAYESAESGQPDKLQQHFGRQVSVLGAQPTLEWAAFTSAPQARTKLRTALTLYLRNYDLHSRQPVFVNDLLLLAVTYLALETDALLAQYCVHHLLARTDKRDQAMTEALAKMDLIRQLLHYTGYQDIPDTGERSAFSYFSDEAPAARATGFRSLLTAPLGQAPACPAARLWTAAVRDLYIPRWKAFHEYIGTHKRYDESAWRHQLDSLHALWIKDGSLTSGKAPLNDFNEALQQLKLALELPAPASELSVLPQPGK